MTDDTGTSTGADGPPEFGPGGYLPERAARRARKIVLRREMGLQWPIAAAVAAVVVGVLGLVFLLTRTGPPGPPFVATTDLGTVAPRSVTVVTAGATDVLLVRSAGDVAVLTPPDAGVTWCQASRRLEATDGRVWTSDGRLVGGAGRSLARHALQIHDGTVYVDPQSGAAVPAAPERGERPACR